MADLAMFLLGGCSNLDSKPSPMLPAETVVGTWVHEDRESHRSEITFSEGGEFFGSNTPQKVFDFGSDESTATGFGDDLNWASAADPSGSWNIDGRDVWITIEDDISNPRSTLPLRFGSTRGALALGRYVGSPDDFNSFDLYWVLSDD